MLDLYTTEHPLTWSNGRSFPLAFEMVWPFRLPLLNVRQAWPTKTNMTAKQQLGPDDVKNFNQEFPGLAETGSYVQHSKLMGRS